MTSLTTAKSARVLGNYIEGAWTEPSVTDTLTDLDPASGEVLAKIPLSGGAEVDAAVQSAVEAQRQWRDVAPQKRARALMDFAVGLRARHEELAQLVSRDLGKTIDDARGEVMRGIESTEAACGAPHLLKGENLEGVGPGVDVEMVRQPVGVVAAITPFNFPAMIPLWFLPFALVCGNGFILKPSERDPLPSELIFDVLAGVDGIPSGLANLVHGARDAVNAILDHPGVDAVSFVGQASTARYVNERCAQMGRRCQALGGAKNSMVVMPDADLQSSVPAIISSAFGNAGQRCMAGSVLVVVGDEARRTEVSKQVAATAGDLKIGPGPDPSTELSPLVAAEARERVASAVGDALDAGGSELILDGRGVDSGPAGTYLGATIVEVSDPECDLAREEQFGPLLTVVGADDLDAALEFVNGSRYGNASVIFTTSGAAARTYRNRVEAGMVGINVGVAAPVAWFPFSGWKDSIDGDLHANGTDAIEFYTRKKTLTSRWPSG